MTSEDRLKKSEWFVAPTSGDVAERMIQLYHYARTGGRVCIFVHGLFRHDDPTTCRGVACWKMPIRAAAEANWAGDFREVLSLSRLAVHPDVPRNAASFLIGRSIDLIREDGRYICLLTYADTWQGHTGAIYKATNWEYLGTTQPQPIWLSEQGKLGSRKNGWKPGMKGGGSRTYQEMRDLGYTMIGRFAKHRYRMVITPKTGPRKGQLALLPGEYDAAA